MEAGWLKAKHPLIHHMVTLIDEGALGYTQEEKAEALMGLRTNGIAVTLKNYGKLAPATPPQGPLAKPTMPPELAPTAQDTPAALWAGLSSLAAAAAAAPPQSKQGTPATPRVVPPPWRAPKQHATVPVAEEAVAQQGG
jgi:hypothetical protein